MDNQTLPRSQATRAKISRNWDHWQYMRYIEGINANGDPRVTILSFSEWLNDGKPSPQKVQE